MDSIAIQCVSINNVLSEPLPHTYFNPCCHGYCRRFESIYDVAFSIAPPYLLNHCYGFMQIVYINCFAFPISPYHTYLFSVAMDTTMNNADSIIDAAFPIAPYHTYLFSVAMDTTMNNADSMYY